MDDSPQLPEVKVELIEDASEIYYDEEDEADESYENFSNDSNYRLEDAGYADPTSAMETNDGDELTVQDGFNDDSILNESEIEQGDGTSWYRCKYCSVLFEDMMLFLFHIRQHEQEESSSNLDHEDELNDAELLQRELSESKVQVYNPQINLRRVQSRSSSTSGNSTKLQQLPPMPRLYKAPPSNQSSQQHRFNISGESPKFLGNDDSIPLKSCKICPDNPIFENKTSFVDHLFQKHRHDNEFFCPKPGCHYTSQSVQYFEQHCEKHGCSGSRHAKLKSNPDLIRSYICHLCIPKTRYLQSTKYARHMRNHLGIDNRYHCRHCNYSSPSLQLFNKHIRKSHPQHSSANGAILRASHNPSSSDGTATPMIYVCYICIKHWASRTAYMTHMVIKHRNAKGKFNCSDCGYAGDTVRCLSRHYRIRHKGEQIRALLHGKQLANDAEIEIDELSNQSQSEMPALIPTTMSNKQLQQNSALLRARLSTQQHQGVSSTKTTATTTGASSSNMLACPLCESTVLASPTLYFDHIFQNHCRDNTVSCSRCSFRSISIETVQHHYRKHHGKSNEGPQRSSTQIVRNVAGGIANGSGGGDRSMISMGGSRQPYLCRFCYQEFTEVVKYSAHMRIHVGGDGNFKCPYCPLAFKTLNRFNEHVKRTHEQNDRGLAKRMYQRAPAPPGTSAISSATTMARKLTSIALNNSRKLHTEMRKPIQDKTYYCYYCDIRGLQFFSVKLYSRHMKELHQNEDGTYSCPHCVDVVCPSLKKINEHLKRKSHLHVGLIRHDDVIPRDEDDGELEELSTGTNEGQANQQHKTETISSGTSKWFQCRTCSVLLPTKEKLLEHQKLRNHGTLQQLKLEQPKPTRYEGGVLSNEQLQKGLGVGVSPQQVQVQLPMYKCKLCTPNEWFRTKWRLNEHVQARHPHPSYPQIKNDSGQSSTSTASQKDGSSQSTGRREFKCVFCQEIFRNQNQYVFHTKSNHTDAEGKFNCWVCGFTTDNLPTATKHISRHFRTEGRSNGSSASKRNPSKRKRRTGLFNSSRRRKRSRSVQPSTGNSIDQGKLEASDEIIIGGIEEDNDLEEEMVEELDDTNTFDTDEVEVLAE